MSKIWDVYQEGPIDVDTEIQLPQAAAWAFLVTNFRLLCSHAGLAEIMFNPLQNIANLRKQVERWMIYAGDLQQTIKKLEQEQRMHQRIIAALSFRHLLEYLPEPSRNGPPAYAKNWQDFWDKAWEAAGNAIKSGHDHPLKHLRIKNEGRTKQVINRAHYLYGTLSNSIHGYCQGPVVLSADQWDPDDFDILSALKSISAFSRDADWVTKRQQFLTIQPKNGNAGSDGKFQQVPKEGKPC